MGHLSLGINHQSVIRCTNLSFVELCPSLCTVCGWFKGYTYMFFQDSKSPFFHIALDWEFLQFVHIAWSAQSFFLVRCLRTVCLIGQKVGVGVINADWLTSWNKKRASHCPSSSSVAPRLCTHPTQLWLIWVVEHTIYIQSFLFRINKSSSFTSNNA